jgi:diguanylate cyclase (GGDEF)-like protein
VNDNLGHEAGDELLRQIGQRLQMALRPEDFGGAGLEAGLISRFGGDEFLILINHLHSTTDAVRVAERLLNTLTASYNLLGHEVQSTASVGIVTSDQCTGSAEEFVRNADMAMYEAKRAGRGCAVVFSEAMHARLIRHLSIETSLRRAIGTRQLYLEYQPVVDLDTGRRRSVEVTVRWNHPTMGPITPEEFLPIAEKSGLLVAIGQWMLEDACREMVEWTKSGVPQTPDTISINLSAAEIALGDRLTRRVRGALQSSGLPPGSLQFEVSESELMRNPAAVEVFRELRGLGVKLAIDEFGAGHGSLSVLQNHPLDAVKIDRSFLLNLHGSHGSLAVLSATLTLIRNLGLQSIADGVEDSTQVAILQSLGCQCAQGPFFGFSIDAGKVLAAAVVP